MKHINTFESFLNEGFMIELDIIRQESKTLQEFIKSAISTFHPLKEEEKFLEELWKTSSKFDESLDTSLSITDYDEYVKPDYVEVTLSDGRKLQIKRKNVTGGQKFYQAVLYALDNYKSNPKAKAFMDSVVNAIRNNLDT